jgi:hypothetical protein
VHRVQLPFEPEAMCPKDSAVSSQGSSSAASKSCSSQPPGGAWAKGFPLGITSESCGGRPGFGVPSDVPVCMPQVIRSLAMAYTHSALVANSLLRMARRCRSGGRLEPGHAAAAGAVGLVAHVILDTLQLLEMNGMSSGDYSYITEKLPGQLLPVIGSMYGGVDDFGKGVRLDVSSMACCSVCGLVLSGESHVHGMHVTCERGGLVSFVGFQQQANQPSHTYNPLSIRVIDAHVREARARLQTSADSSGVFSYGVCPLFTGAQGRPGIDRWISTSQKQSAVSMYRGVEQWSQQERDILAAAAAGSDTAQFDMSLLPNHALHADAVVAALRVPVAELDDPARCAALMAMPWVVGVYDIMCSQQQPACQSQQVTDSAVQQQPLTPRQQPALHYVSSSSSSYSCSPSSSSVEQSPEHCDETSSTATAMPHACQGSTVIQPQPAYGQHVSSAEAAWSVSPYVPAAADFSSVQSSVAGIHSCALYHFQQVQLHSNMYKHCCYALTESQSIGAHCMQLLDGFHWQLRQQLQQQQQQCQRQPQRSSLGSPSAGHVQPSHKPSSAIGVGAFRG